MKAKPLLKAPAKKSVRVQLLASLDTRADSLATSSGLSKPNIIALAAVEGMPLLARKLNIPR